MTKTPDEIVYDRAMRRLNQWMLVFGAGGALVLLAWRGWRWGAGFVLGSIVSWLNFRWLKQAAEALGGRHIRLRVAVLAGLRYVILGFGAYVILRFSPISLYATLAGLFVSLAAAFVVAVIELSYARK